jgi:hypothetical protein
LTPPELWMLKSSEDMNVKPTNWLRLWRLMALCVAVFGAAILSHAAYDYESPASIYYDDCAKTAFSYDGGVMPVGNENEGQLFGSPVSFGHFVGFLAAKTTALELNTATTWGRAETLADHFARHGGDFAVKTADDYAGMASRFFQESQAAKLPTKIDSQGVIRVFDPKTGSFGSFNPNGTTRTFFKPSSPTYFDRQPGTFVP